SGPLPRRSPRHFALLSRDGDRGGAGGRGGIGTVSLAGFCRSLSARLGGARAGRLGAAAPRARSSVAVGNSIQMDDESGLDARLQLLLAKRGQELVKGLADEIMRLHREIGGLKRELAALGEYQAMRDRWLGGADAGLKGAALPRNLAVTPDQMLSPRDGFHPAE